MSALSPMGAFVRRHDPDRFLCTLFAPPPARETLFVLYAFNHELARAWEVARMAPLALIRLQWWREVVEGAERHHEVATPLRAEIAAGRLEAASLLALVEAREAAEDPCTDLAAWWGRHEAGAGALAVAAGRVLGTAAPRLRTLGAGYGAVGQTLSLPVLARLGRCPVPERLLDTAGITAAEAAARPDDPRLAAPRRAMLDWARTRLGRPEHPASAAGLVGVLARRDAARGARRRGVTDRLAVAWAAWRGVA